MKFNLTHPIKYIKRRGGLEFNLTHPIKYIKRRGGLKFNLTHPIKYIKRRGGLKFNLANCSMGAGSVLKSGLAGTWNDIMAVAPFI